MQTAENLLNNLNIKKYKMTEEDVLPCYVYAKLLGCLPEKIVRHRHYKINNDFVRKYVFRFCEDQTDSFWCSPAELRDAGAMLIGRMAMEHAESLGSVAVRLSDSTPQQSFYVCDDEIMYSLYLFGGELLEDSVIYELVYTIGGVQKMSFAMFCTKNKQALSAAAALQDCIKFCDCDCTLTYRAVSPQEYNYFTASDYAATFFKNKAILGDFVRTLAEYITPTEGLKKLDKRSVELFWKMYNGDDPVTLSERKLFFREMSASSGALSYTQSGSNFLLLKLKEVCAKLGINYWLYYGTLLGAKRHGAFIPWDDDIDVGMMRSDLHRLADFLKDDKHFSIDVLYNTEWADRVYKFRFTGEYLPVYVDIFPFDYCRGDSVTIWNNLKKIKSEMVREFRSYEERTGNHFRRTFNIPQPQLDEINGMFDIFRQKASSLMGLTTENTGKIVYGYDTVFLFDWMQVFELDEIRPFEMIGFNGGIHPAFKNGDEVLVKNYVAPYTLPDDIVSHRHTVRMNAESIARLENLMESLKNYKF